MSCGVELERLDLPKIQKSQNASGMKRKSATEITKLSQKTNKRLKVEIVDKCEAEPLKTDNVAVAEQTIKKSKTQKKRLRKFRSYSVTVSPSETNDGSSFCSKLKIRFRKIEDDNSRDSCKECSQVDCGDEPKYKPESIADVSNETEQKQLELTECKDEIVMKTDKSQDVLLKKCVVNDESTNSFESLLEDEKILKAKKITNKTGRTHKPMKLETKHSKNCFTPKTVDSAADSCQSDEVLKMAGILDESVLCIDKATSDNEIVIEEKVAVTDKSGVESASIKPVLKKLKKDRDLTEKTAQQKANKVSTKSKEVKIPKKSALEVVTISHCVKEDKRESQKKDRRSMETERESESKGDKKVGKFCTIS